MPWILKRRCPSNKTEIKWFVKNDALRYFKIEESKKRMKQWRKQRWKKKVWCKIGLWFWRVSSVFFFIFVLFRCGARLDRDCRGFPALSCLSCRISPKHCQVASHYTSSGCFSDKNIIKTSQTPPPLQILTFKKKNIFCRCCQLYNECVSPSI